MTPLIRVWHRIFYRAWACLLHALDLHHTVTIGPLEPGGGFVERCEWCGLSRSYGCDGDKLRSTR